jgi:hypothetical protein
MLKAIRRIEKNLKSGRLAISGLPYKGQPLSDTVSLSYQFRSKRYLEQFGITIKRVFS